jgi:hypothetical protein
MRCASHYSTRLPTRLLLHGYTATPAVQAEAPAATGTNLPRRLTGRPSAAGPARDCRRRSALAAVMQVRPLSVSSGIAGLSPFGRSAFGPLGCL